MNSKAPLLACLLVTLTLAASCAPTPPDTLTTAPGAEAGFWKGLWHGVTVLFTFVISLFNDSVGIYEAHNKGNLYNLGFVLGIMIFFGGSGGGACKKG